MKTLVIIEHDNQQLKPVNLNVLTAALEMDADIDALVVGHNCQVVADELKQFAQIKQILILDEAIYTNPLAENLAPIIQELAAEYVNILMPATTFGKNILPRVAALLDVQMISDVSKILGDKIYQRPIYAGNALADVQSLSEKQLLTIRATAFSALEKTSGNASINKVQNKVNNELSSFIGNELHASERPELTAANIVISGGRGLQDKAGFQRLIEVADRMHAAIGASRAAVDAGLAPNDFQVGQTGQVVAPKLYIAVGISGAIQHLAGMKDSKIIVAINKDPDAPIFQVADYGLVADLFEVLPEWEAALTAMDH